MARPAAHRALDRLCDAVTEAWPLHRFADVTTMVAVSGGADSVGLLRALAHLLATHSPGGAAHFRGRIVVLHYNHRLRGEHSEEDERFVSGLAASLGLDWEIQRAAESRPLPQHAVDEASLRGERYAFFDAVAHRRGARYVVTAHTADDNVETVLHQLFRGTGPAGMAGMPLFRELGTDVVLARPLLAVRREQIREALQEIDQPWREDASNLDHRWQRNWIRGSLLPEIRNRYPDADPAISRLARQQTEMIDWLHAAASEWSASHITTSPGGPLRIDVNPRTNPRANARTAPQFPPRTVVIAALRQAWDRCGWPRGAMAERHWNSLAGLIAAAAEPPSAEPPSAALPVHLPVNLPGSLRARIADRGSVVVAAIGGD